MAVINSVDNKVSKMKQCICAVLVFNTLMVSLFSGHLYIAYIRVSQAQSWGPTWVHVLVSGLALHN